jgi:hypothetical protein
MKLRKRVCALLCAALLMTGGTAWGQEMKGYRVALENAEVDMGGAMRCSFTDLVLEAELLRGEDAWTAQAKLKNLDEALMGIQAYSDQEQACIGADGLDVRFAGEDIGRAVQAFAGAMGGENEAEPESEGQEMENEWTWARIQAIGAADLAAIAHGWVEYEAEHGLGVELQGETTVEIGGKQRSARHYTIAQSSDEDAASREGYLARHPELNDYLDIAQRLLYAASHGLDSSLIQSEEEKRQFEISGDQYLAQDGSLLKQEHVKVTAKPGHQKEFSDYEYDVRSVIADGWIEMEYVEEDRTVQLKLPLDPEKGLNGAVCHQSVGPLEVKITHDMKDVDWSDGIQLEMETWVEYQERDGMGYFVAQHRETPIFPEIVDEKIAEERSELKGLQVLGKTATEQYKEIFEMIMEREQHARIDVDFEQNRGEIEWGRKAAGRQQIFSADVTFQPVSEAVSKPDGANSVTLSDIEDGQTELTEQMKAWGKERWNKLMENDALRFWLDGMVIFEE